jgi:hypothetical protein
MDIFVDIKVISSAGYKRAHTQKSFSLIGLYCRSIFAVTKTNTGILKSSRTLCE